MRRVDDGRVASHSHATLHAVRISNGLYGSSVLSSFETVKEFTRSLSGLPTTASVELHAAQLELDAKKKLMHIPRSKSNVNSKLVIGDLVEVFVKSQHEKTWEIDIATHSPSV